MKKFLSISVAMILIILSTQVYANQPWSKPNYTQIPPGSYAQTCSSCRMGPDYTLKCTCADRSGMPRKTFLPNTQYCRWIENIDGQLQCSQRSMPRNQHYRRQ